VPDLDTSPILLPPRWTLMTNHAMQQGYLHSAHRFNVVPAGRRSGKSEIAKRRLVKRAMRGTRFLNSRFFAAAPTYGQAKRIYWSDLKLLVPDWAKRGRPSESELVIPLRTGAEIHVFGMDKPERIEGSPWDGGILDEYGNMKSQAWGANVRPALSDRRGWCDLIGVPEGRNHYYDVKLRAEADVKENGDAATWGYYHWFSSDILPPEEIAMAKQDLDLLTYQQEYEGSFINFEGRAYYVFDSEIHSAPLVYNPKAPISFCFDFNVDPGVAAICQEQMLPSNLIGTGVIGEVYIERNSNTPAVCRKLIADWGKHQGRISCYGDATGGARGTAKVEGSDWDLIKATLNPHFGSRISYLVDAANPAERARINAVNSRLMSASGDIRLIVDGSKAPHVVKDLDGVVLLKGGSGELDKKATPALTHISDALGYYIAKEFPIVQKVMQRVSMGGT
jgi:hypothetical protein